MSHANEDTHQEEHEHAEDTRFGGLNTQTYLIGFLVSVVLTVIPFAAVGSGWLGVGTTLAIVAITAVAQIVLHLFCFLHLDFSDEQAWNAGSAAFTVLILAVLVGGTLWLMYSLEMRTMVGQ